MLQAAVASVENAGMRSEPATGLEIDDPVATIRIDRPDELGAFTDAMIGASRAGRGECRDRRV